MNYYPIKNAVCDLASIFTEAGYTEKTIKELKRNIQKVVELHLEKGEQFYSPDIVDPYVSQLKTQYESGTISRSRKNALIKAASYVQEIATTGMIHAGVKDCNDKLTPYYRSILELVKSSSDWSEALRRNIGYTAHTYFRFLADNGIQNINKITEEIVRYYIIQKASVIAPNSINTIRRNLKHLHIWLYENNYVQSDFSELLSFTTPHSHRINKPVPHEEIALMLQAVNRESRIGKRDYAMLMMAIATGMRSVDIAALRFSDIDWINGEIKIFQKKTNVSLALPLTADVGEALKDYILHGRQKNDTDIIFLTSRPPVQPLGRRAVYSAFNHIRAVVGLKKCPFHSLRRTVGTNMVITGIPVTTVAQVLGHTAISSTKQYISLDSVHLKECALGLEGITKKGGVAR